VWKLGWASQSFGAVNPNVPGLPHDESAVRKNPAILPAPVGTGVESTVRCCFKIAPAFAVQKVVLRIQAEKLQIRANTTDTRSIHPHPPFPVGSSIFFSFPFQI
jgi:hypothetical protein